MKLRVGQIDAMRLGAIRGAFVALLCGTILTTGAHLVNPAVTWLYPGISLSGAVAAHLFYTVYLHRVAKK